jgi:hypothetical protein
MRAVGAIFANRRILKLMRATWSLGIALVFAAALLALRVDDVAGLYVDDAWYVLLGKALASGHGFTLLNPPTPGIVPFYPPAFPFVLSLVFRVAPEFPGNVFWLKLPSILSVLGTAAVAFVYFRRERALDDRRALLMSLVVLFFPGLVFLATSTVMSEPFFAFTQISAVALTERVLREQRGRAIATAAAAGALVAVTALGRSIALPLLPIATAYLVWRRRTREALVAAATALVLIGPWFAYARVHAPTPAQQQVVNDQITVPYTAQFWLRLAGSQQYGWAKASELPGRFVANLRSAGLYSVGALYAYPLFRLIEPGEWRWSLTGGVISAVLAALTLLGFARTARRRVTLAEIYVIGEMAIILAFPYPSYRYMVPLLPFFLIYTCEGIAAVVARSAGRAEIGAAAVTVFLVTCLLSHVALDVAPLVGSTLGGASRSAWQRSFDDNRALLDWVRQRLPDDAIVATQNPAMVHLYTGRRTVGYWMPATDVKRWRAAGVSYWVDCWYEEEKYPDWSATPLPVLYRSPELHGLVVDLARQRRRGS